MDAAMIEETNRIRVSLGMKPLPVPGANPPAQDSVSNSDEEEPASTVETRQAQAYDNYNKAMEADAAKRRREERAAAVRKAREKAQMVAAIEGKGLGDEDENGEVDAKSWLMGQKKRQKKIAKTRKLEEELAAAEAAAAAQVQYTSKDLAGVKVAHESSAFLDGNDQILTLKDATIDENEEEGDELENLDLREQEKLTDRLDLKKKRPGYNPNDEEDDGGVLAQYDEDIDGKKKKTFTLDSKGVIAELSDILSKPVETSRQKQSINLDDIVGDGAPSNDYFDLSEIKVKKPKKKKKNAMRKKQDDEDDIFPIQEAANDDQAMELDNKDEAPAKKRKISDDTIVDDEDLQATLAIQRKNALKKRKRTRPEDFLKQLKQEGSGDDDAAKIKEDEESGGGLVLGEISEFVSGLAKPEDEEDVKVRRRKASTKSPVPDEDHSMGRDDDDDEKHIKREQSASLEPQDENNNNRDDNEDEEKAVGAGMGAALALLRERGLVKKSDSDNQFQSFRDREEFLSRKRVLEEELEEETRKQRERDRTSGRMDRMSVREREEHARQQNNWRDHQHSRRMAELFSAGYKPNVELTYTDEHGRSLDQKDAFKQLSHQFHGKGSGKGKTEKMLKKMEDEKRRESQSLFDASQEGMNRAAQQQVKKRREAGVRLG